MSSSEHAPGPRGSPHDPQAPPPPSAIAADFSAEPDTAKRESCCSSFFPPHFGHFGVFDPITIVSKLCLHSRQMYSKIGMADRVSWNLNDSQYYRACVRRAKLRRSNSRDARLTKMKVTE